MCYSLCSNKFTECLGFFLNSSLILSLVIILAIILFSSGLPSKYFSMSTPLILLIVCTLLYLLLCLIIGSFSFCNKNKILLTFYLILLVILLLLTLGICILAITQGTRNSLDTFLGCNTKNQELNNTYQAYDSYLLKVDEKLCSSDCICYLNLKLYKNNSSNSTEDYSFINNWQFKNESTYAKNFLQCNNTRDALKNEFNKQFDLDYKAFESLYSILESLFNCSGFCSKSSKIMKYLYSDVNLGIPEISPCMDALTDWMPQKLRNIGIYAVLFAVVEIIIIFLTLSVLKSKEGGK